MKKNKNDINDYVKLFKVFADLDYRNEYSLNMNNNKSDKGKNNTKK